MDPRSIAVLPFVDVGLGLDDWLAEGIAEELVGALSRVDGLRVASRTSSFAFRGKPVTVPEIGERLEVASVLEGSVRKDGDRLRVQPRLVDAREGHALWSESYQTDLSDIFEIQERIAHAVADALEIRVAGRSESVARRPTRELDAYQLYLRGRYHWNRHTPADLERSVQCFEEAIARPSIRSMVGSSN